MLGWVLVRSGETEKGLKELQEASERLRRDPLVLYHLGMAYYKKNDLKEAKKALQAAVQISKNFPGADHALEVLKNISHTK